MKLRDVSVGIKTNISESKRMNLVVMTYNVLAQCYVRSSFFPYCNSKALRWKTRSKMLREQIAKLSIRPDVICLQEVDQYDDFWKGTMHGLGYDGIFSKKASTKKDGVAIFWIKDKFSLMAIENIALDDPIGDEKDCSEDLLERVKRGNVGVVTRMKAIENSLEFVLATTHLFWDPCQEDVKLLQTRRLLHHLSDFHKQQNRILPLILAGDFNSLPKSQVYDWILKQGHLLSAYSKYRAEGEPAFTNVNGVKKDDDGKETASFIGTLDYIFHNHKLIPHRLYELMSFEEATNKIALPNTTQPSDHLPLICDFVMSQ